MKESLVSAPRRRSQWSSRPLFSALKKFVPMLAAAAGLLTAGVVQAVPIVTNGSTYAVYLGSDMGTNLATLAVFDGVAEVVALDFGGEATINESQMDLGGGLFQIDISIMSDVDLFPFALGGSGGLTNIGLFSDPLSLMQDFTLTSAILSYSYGDGSLAATGEALGQISNPDPWDGFFTGPGLATGFTPVVGIGIQKVDLRFIGQVSPSGVPESGTTVAMLGMVFGGLALRRRR